MLDLSANEEKILEYWRKNKILEKVRERNRGHKKFYFLDGPPFVSGDLHPAQMWTKTLKDIAVRYKRYRGFDVVDRPGYDVHGLPVENRLEKELGVQSKKEIEEKIGIERFVGECRAFVERYKGRMDADYERFGISLDFSNPYLPYTNEYILTAWQLFKKMAEKGFLYKGKRTLIYCPHCETPLSQGSMEVEYREVDDPSLYVALKIDLKRSRPKTELPDGSCLVIWTTTPWTLPANVAVAVNPKTLYVLVEAGGRKLIMAKDRLDSFVSETGLNALVLKEFYGSQLDNTYYINPLEEKVPMQKKLRRHHKIIFSESLVSMGEGTGLVHIAPGNGVDDFAVGKLNRLPIFSPVTPEARYSEEAGEYKGKEVPGEANRAVIEDLEKLGVLLANITIRHSYPYCWRCGSKLIFIATDQWFMNVQRFKKRMIAQNEKVEWHPAEVKAWERAVLENSPDWCISRQRYWGIPMPIWSCSSCTKIKILSTLAELREGAVNKEAVGQLKDLHRPYIDGIRLKCECGGEMARIKDILDGWFDSGITFRASLSEEQFERLFPVDLIVEYVEQIRAWFQYLMKCGIMGYGKIPFRRVMVHGIMAGTDGRKMSKSFGNFRPLEELTRDFTADAFRFWSADHDPILNRNLNEDEIKESMKLMIMLYNISNLYSEYSEAIGYKPPRVRKPRAPGKLDPEDAWIASRLNRMLSEVTKGLEGYEVYQATTSIKRFVIEDLSRFYLKAAKRNVLYSNRKKARQTIDLINYLIFNTLVAISPLVPFVAEKIYLDIYGAGTAQEERQSDSENSKKESVFMEEWPRFDGRLMNENLEEDFGYAIEAITALLNAREKAGIRLRQPLSDAVIEVNKDSVYNALQRLSYLIEDYVNIKKVGVRMGTATGKEIKPLFAEIGPEFKENAVAVADALRNANADELLAAIEASGHYSLHTERGTFNIREGHFTVIEKAFDSAALAFRHGIVHINPKIDDELREDALLREFERSVQLARKKLSLKKADRIRLHYRLGPELLAIVEKNRKRISRELNAKELKELKSENEGYEVEIAREPARIMIEKAD